MRRALVLLVTIATLCLGSGSASAAGSQALNGKFSAFFPKAGQQLNVYQCPTGVFCGIGRLEGYGPTEIDVFDDNFQPVAGTNCLSFDKEDDLVVLATGSTLVLVGSGMLCFPGNSGNEPPAPANQDYGHPSFWVSNLTLNGSRSTGVFAGASGTAVEDFTVAGGVGIWQVSGALSLA